MKTRYFALIVLASRKLNTQRETKTDDNENNSNGSDISSYMIVTARLMLTVTPYWRLYQRPYESSIFMHLNGDY